MTMTSEQVPARGATTARYRVRPGVVDAIRYTPGRGGNCDVVAEFIGGARGDHDDDLCNPECVWVFATADAEVTAEPGDWIVRRPDGRIDVFNHVEFDALYEPLGSSERPATTPGDPYTPTTEQMRRVFVEAYGAGDAFDRWLAGHDAARDAARDGVAASAVDSSLGYQDAFIEYGVSYGSEDPRRGTWTSSYDEAMQDAAFRASRQGDALGEITVMQRLVTNLSTGWVAAVRPEVDVTDRRTPNEECRLTVMVVPVPEGAQRA